VAIKKIGIIFGMENTFPGAFVEKVNSMGHRDVHAEFVKIGGIRMAEPSGYRVIVDRISHDIPFYRAYLKNAALSGTIVINNPFWWSADDKFFNYALAEKLGVAVPPTVILPHKQHPVGTTDQSMRNLIYPMNWDEVFQYVGFPAFLKPFNGGGWRDVYHVHTPEDFFHAYDQTRDLCMTLQRAVKFQEYFRCYVVGQESGAPADDCQIIRVVRHARLHHLSAFGIRKHSGFSAHNLRDLLAVLGDYFACGCRSRSWRYLKDVVILADPIRVRTFDRRLQAGDLLANQPQRKLIKSRAGNPFRCQILQALQVAHKCKTKHQTDDAVIVVAKCGVKALTRRDHHWLDGFDYRRTLEARRLRRCVLKGWSCCLALDEGQVLKPNLFANIVQRQNRDGPAQLHEQFSLRPAEVRHAKCFRS